MKEININTNKLLPAPIDDKNVLSDWLFDALFDNEEYTFDKNEAMGFVGGYPTYLEHSDNCAFINYIKRDKKYEDEEAWMNSILGKLAEQDTEEKPRYFPVNISIGYTFLDDSVEDVEQQHILEITAYGDTVRVRFFWNVEKN